VIAGLAVAALTVLAPAGSHPGACTTAEPTGVTVVIDYQRLGGATEVICALGLAGGATGRDALAAAGVAAQGTAHDGDSFVCRLRGRPSASETLPRASDPQYKETCELTPPSDAYWSYWSAADGGSWSYASKGPASQRVRPGGFEGWSFNLGGASAPAPRVAPVRVAAPPPSAAAPPTEQTDTGGGGAGSDGAGGAAGTPGTSQDAAAVATAASDPAASEDPSNEASAGPTSPVQSATSGSPPRTASNGTSEPSGLGALPYALGGAALVAAAATGTLAWRRRLRPPAGHGGD
jgi:hypothetical protein